MVSPDPGNAPPEDWSEEMPEEEVRDFRSLLRQEVKGGDTNGGGTSDQQGNGRVGGSGRG